MTSTPPNKREKTETDLIGAHYLELGEVSLYFGDTGNISPWSQIPEYRGVSPSQPLNRSDMMASSGKDGRFIWNDLRTVRAHE